MKLGTRITRVKRNDDGVITEVMFENGNTCSFNYAVLMAKQGVLEGYNVVRGKNGGEYLSADPNNPDAENLDDMPRFR
ncbi:hypothetical protein CLHUN_07080 [Ruminiclostridium hungatei]|uniref:DUF3892 domain-containing protein n=1 Tax=Ruminiclostridium hungatei TaxID=48256 RepID=A0A1V4SPJ4_RUMHU|nr:DUF3892 domain-containing protein [Ruminiclostridium hungatei]OPX45770.1 hypothetical protein CLHUN_07080 [Ruminiclostridium hungatei]